MSFVCCVENKKNSVDGSKKLVLVSEVANETCYILLCECSVQRIVASLAHEVI